MTAPAFVHRVCDVTGLKVERKAEVLTRINAVVSIVALLIGAVAAVLLVLTRWQAVHLLPAEWYYRVLGVHGMSMLIFFIIFFEMAVLHFTSTALINARCAAPKTSWFAFALMLVGAVMVEYLMWAGKADVLFTSYVPLRADSNFYLGVILFAVGALTVVGVFFANLVVAKRERTYEGSLPLVVYGATLLIKLINQFPVIVPGGAALIGFVSGEVIVGDPVLADTLGHSAWAHELVPLLGALGIVAVGRIAKPVSSLPQAAAEATVGATAVFGLRLALQVLGRIVVARAPLIVVTIASYFGYTLQTNPDAGANGTLASILQGLRPIFAAVIAIALGEVVAWVVRRMRGPSQE